MEAQEKNCIDCKNHEIIKDPDPHDWFCDDDVAVVCRLIPNDKDAEDSPYLADHSPFKLITSSCRPYNIRKESGTPKWCPLEKTV